MQFMGDHGYQLGEHNLWCKMTVFELGTRVPFMIRLPGSLAEAVDLFPTLVTVAGKAPVAPRYLDGVTLAPILASPTVMVKQAAFSEFVKCYSCCKVPDPAGQPPWLPPVGKDDSCLPPDQKSGPGRHRCPAWPALPADPTDLSEMETCFNVPREHIDFIGYSMRTAEHRYTEWLHCKHAPPPTWFPGSL